MDLTETITWLFVIANTGRILAYVPQLLTAWNCKNGASSVSRLTWGYFAFAHFAGVLYGAFVIHDSKMAWMFSGKLLVCVMLVVIVTWKKMMHARATTAPRQATHEARQSPWGTAVYAIESEGELGNEPLRRGQLADRFLMMPTELGAQSSGDKCERLSAFGLTV